MTALMRRMLVAVESLGIDHSASPCGHVTVSAGAISVVASDEEEIASVLDTADRLLYEAKASGRNRCLHLDRSRNARESITSSMEQPG
jgi:diguanylate cyclase (GGDEF)-like protein